MGAPVGSRHAHLTRMLILDTLLKVQWRADEVVNQAENGAEDLLADLTAVVYSFCAWLYGQRRAKRKSEVIVRELEAKGERDDADATR